MHIIRDLPDICFKTGYTVLENKGVAIVGMSPGNSYFKQDTIHTLLSFAQKAFSKVIIMIPDKPAIHTYKAIGYSSLEAEKIARRAGNRLRNCAQISIDALKAGRAECSIAVFDWYGDIETNKQYGTQKQYIYNLYRTNEQFRKDVRATTAEVIRPRLKQDRELESSCDVAIHFLLEELAFLVACPAIFEQSIAYIYHHRWPIWENLINGVYDDVKKELGFLVIQSTKASGHERF